MYAWARDARHLITGSDAPAASLAGSSVSRSTVFASVGCELDPQPNEHECGRIQSLCDFYFATAACHEGGQSSIQRSVLAGTLAVDPVGRIFQDLRVVSARAWKA